MPFRINDTQTGILCIYSSEQKIFNEETEKENLTSLAHNITLGYSAFKAKSDLNILASAVDHAAESIVITDTKGVIIYVNPCFETLSGYSQAEAIGQYIGIFKSGKHKKEFYNELWEVLQRGESWHGKFTNRKKDGSLYEEDATISSVRDSSDKITHYVAVKRDVTQEMALEKQLRHSQKMEAIGRFARGVAHDFTNLLVVIMNSAEVLKTTIKHNDMTEELLDNILKCSRRGGLMTSQLLSFSQHQISKPKKFDLNFIVREMRDMLHRSLGPDIDLQMKEFGEPVKAVIDPSQIEQAIIHICAMHVTQ